MKLGDKSENFGISAGLMWMNHFDASWFLELISTLVITMLTVFVSKFMSELSTVFFKYVKIKYNERKNNSER